MDSNGLALLGSFVLGGFVVMVLAAWLYEHRERARAEARVRELEASLMVGGRVNAQVLRNWALLNKAALHDFIDAMQQVSPEMVRETFHDFAPHLYTRDAE